MDSPHPTSPKGPQQSLQPEPSPLAQPLPLRPRLPGINSLLPGRPRTPEGHSFLTVQQVTSFAQSRIPRTQPTLPPINTSQPQRLNGSEGREHDGRYRDQNGVYFDRLYPGVPLKVYILENLPYQMERPLNEDYNCTRRVTADGRTLTYALRVLQQPERARACGGGARSSADRRPVDPPPVIELKVYQGTGKSIEELEEITLQHKATFILCASLENARPMAHGKVQVPNNIPSLQGVNFAGTNYLDRPTPAGYFIFPDLSVRNEGFYRLNFSLLEGTKERRDASPTREFPNPASLHPAQLDADGNPIPQQHRPHEDMATRLDVRSKPFQVYSAKKFPGLSNSTELSRLVADQGCRVRIRRDVRMRRHSERRKDEHDDYDNGPRSADRFASPAASSYGQPQTPHAEHPRSHSVVSHDGSHYNTDQFRRPSLDSQYSGQYQYPAPPNPNASFNNPYGGLPPPRMSAPSPVPAYHSYPQSAGPVPSSMMSSSYPTPPARHSFDSNYSSQNQGYPEPPRPPFQMLPAPNTLMRGPYSSEASRPLPSSIFNVINNPAPAPAPAPVPFDSARNTYALPDRQPAKRGPSPRSTYAQDQALKDGRRPDNALPTIPKSALPTVQNNAHPSVQSWEAGPMEADGEPYHSADDSGDDTDPLNMRYKRANGSMGRKQLPPGYTEARQ